MSESKDKHWYAVLVGSKKEKFVVELLHRKGIASYLPLVKRTKRYASRIKTHEVPLISCYVFVEIDAEERISVLQTEYVYKFIQLTDQLTPIPQHEIDIMKQVVGQFDDVEVVDSKQFMQDDYVELLAGELTGIKGTVIEERGSGRYLVKLENLGIQLTWMIEASKLRKAT